MNPEKTGTIFDVQKFSTIDGPGIRTTVFFKGCNLKCAWCHNPESQAFEREMMFYKNKCTGCGKCKEKCPNGLDSCTLCGACTVYCPARAREIVGKEWSVEDIFAEIEGDRTFYETSGGGATFSGGECMLQIDFLEALLQKCKENGIHTAVDTAGHLPFEYFERILPFTDLFLYDVKCFDRETHKRFTGVYNDNILSNLQKLLGKGVPIWIRIPIIPTVNDSREELLKIRDFLCSNGEPQKVELLPYHVMGENKYGALGKDVTRFLPPTDEKMAELRSLFE